MYWINDFSPSSDVVVEFIGVAPFEKRELQLCVSEVLATSRLVGWEGKQAKLF